MIRWLFMKWAERKTERAFARMTSDERNEWDRLALYGSERERAEFVQAIMKKYSV